MSQPTRPVSGDRHPAALDPQELLRQCEIRRVRRSGPGGQRRNKVETGVVLTHRPSGIRAEAAERRSQPENLRVALFRLRIKLALDVRRDVPPGAEPSPLWRSRCRGGRISINPEHGDFPALLAEALDVLNAHEGDVQTTAAALGCTVSQLVKLFKLRPAVLEQVNRRRAEQGLPRLR